ncbi:UNVERIFIED_CONTAM: hypothetical protein K2H54_058293 [Gekko kuhli]
MPGGREDEICQKALRLLLELCSVGAVEHDRCLEFNYYVRESARPRLTDSDGRPSPLCLERCRVNHPVLPEPFVKGAGL